MHETLQQSSIVWEYGQPWLVQIEPAFTPGWVSIGRDNDGLVIRADLDDTHVMMDVFPFNYPAFMQCDVFEIFIGPAGGQGYYELHVTPSNSVLQLYFDGSNTKKTLEERMVAQPLFTSQTHLTPRGWSALVRISLKSLFSASHAEWLLSFGRYDYSPSQPKPVISSTSLHTVCDFHRKQEWRRVVLESLPLLPKNKF